jgi:hypothetical protein
MYEVLSWIFIGFTVNKKKQKLEHCVYITLIPKYLYLELDYMQYDGIQSVVLSRLIKIR